MGEETLESRKCSDSSSEMILDIQILHLHNPRLIQFALTGSLFPSMPAKKRVGNSIAIESQSVLPVQKWKEMLLELTNAFYKLRFLGERLKSS